MTNALSFGPHGFSGSATIASVCGERSVKLASAATHATGVGVRIDALVHAGHGPHLHRLRVPAGHAALVLHAVPDTTDVAPSASVTCCPFAIEAADLARQFDRFCASRSLLSSHCQALTVVVDRAGYLQHAMDFGRRLRATHAQITAITSREYLPWHVALIAYFLANTVGPTEE